MAWAAVTAGERRICLTDQKACVLLAQFICYIGELSLWVTFTGKYSRFVEHYVPQVNVLY